MKVKYIAGKHANEIKEVSDAEGADLVEKGFAEEVKEADGAMVAVEKFNAAVDAKVEAASDDIARKAIEKFTAGVSKKGKIVVGNDNVQDDPAKGFKSFGDFAQTVKNNPNDARIKAAGLTGGTDVDGAVAVPPLFSDQFINTLVTQPSLVDLSDNIPLSGPGRSIAFPLLSYYNYANTDATLGPVAQWVAEGGTKPISKPQFEVARLTLKKVATIIPTTDELLEDTAALGAYLMQAGAFAVNQTVNSGIIRGDGSSAQPLGILNSAATVTVDRPGADPDLQALAEMYARFWGNPDTAVWIMNPAAFPHLATLNSPNGFPLYLPSGSVAGKPFETLFGIPVIRSMEASAYGSKGDIILADMKEYLSITKGGLQTASSIHLYFRTDETAFRFVYRMDGRPKLSHPITPKNGTDTLSPFVVLGAASGT